MRTIFKIFFTAEGTRPFLVLFCLLFASVAEVIGMGTLLPLASQLAGGVSEHSSQLNTYVYQSLEWLGLGTGLGTMILIISGLLAIKAIVAFAALSYAGIAAAKVAVNVRRKLINAVFDARWSYYSSQSAGKFANALSIDSTRAGEAYLLAAQTISRLSQLLAYSTIAFFVDWRLASLALVSGAILLVIFSSLVTMARRAGNLQNKQMQKLATLMVDVVTNIKPLKSMSRYQNLVGGMGSLLRGMRRALIVRELSINGMMQGGDLLIAIMVGAGVYLANSFWKTPLPELVVSGVIFFQIVSAASRMQRQLQRAVSMENSYERIVDITEKAKSNAEPVGGGQKPDIGTGCRFEDVAFAHRRKYILGRINIEFPANKITVLQGVSGAGKTTLVDMLIGLHRPTSGRVLIGDAPLEQIDLKAWRRQIGYVPQELHLLHATIRDNVALGDTSISDERVVAALRLAGVGELLDRKAGLDAWVGEMGSKLSGGQRQRISIARALVTEPKLLIFDEVTSALDPETEAAIVESIKNLKNSYTIVAVTHRPAWAQVADRLYFVAKRRAQLLKPSVADTRSQQTAKARKTTAPRKRSSRK